MARIAYLGVYDWRHSEWAGRFYPEDLPEDWRWAYYVTQYSCIWLDRKAWEALDSSTMSLMAAECPEDFEILLQDDGVNDGHLASLIEAAQGHARATANADACILRFGAETDLSQLSTELTRAAHRPPLYLLSMDADLTMLERVSTLLELLGL